MFNNAAVTHQLWSSDLWTRSFLVALVICVVAASSAFATERDIAESASGTSDAVAQPYPPYCGIYSLYGAALLQGAEVPFERLLRPEYIGCSQGSSLEELERAARDHRLYAAPVANMNGEFLRNCPYPVILHTKSDTSGKYYNHYVLFMGTRQGRAAIWDAGKPIALLAFDQLVGLWDGKGLIVSAQPIDVNSLLARSRWRFVLWTGVVLGVIGVLKLAQARYPSSSTVTRHSMGRSLSQAGMIALVSTSAAFIHNLSADAGLLTRGSATAEIERASAASFISKSGVAEAKRIHAAGGTVFIDARLSVDFDAGHVPGAINVPPGLPAAERRATLAKIAKTTPIIVYCQSIGCSYAKMVATALLDEGYQNVQIFPGGWVEWSK